MWGPVWEERKKKSVKQHSRDDSGDLKNNLLFFFFFFLTNYESRIGEVLRVKADDVILYVWNRNPFLFVCFLFRAAPVACGSSQAESHQSCSCRPTPQATVTPNPSLVWDLHHSSRQCEQPLMVLLSYWSAWQGVLPPSKWQFVSDHRPLPLPFLSLKGVWIWTEARGFFETRVCHLLGLLGFLLSTLLLAPATHLQIDWPLCSEQREPGFGMYHQCWILNPPSEAWDQTCTFINTSWILNPLSHNRNPYSYF